MRIFFFILGFIMLVYGMSLMIIYLNLTTIGYNLWDYVNFIIGRFDFYVGIIGLIIIILTMTIRKRG